MGFDTEKLLTSNYLAGGDVEPFLNVTIHSLTQEEFKQRDGSMQVRTIVWFKEVEKGLKTNNGILRTMIQLLGKGNTDEWVGKQVQLYPLTTEFGGEEYYVARVRAVREVTRPCAAPIPADPNKQAWAKFYLTLDDTQKASVNATLGGSPSQWMAKTGKDINACIAFLKAAFKIGAEPEQPPLDDIPF